MISDSIIVKRVWNEMHKIKGYIRQIEIYTSRKRHNAKVVSLVAIISSIMCIISCFLNEYESFRWATIVSAIMSSGATILKEFIPKFFQPESELCELDSIHDFYKTQLLKMENLFTQRYEKNSDMNDEQMLKCFDEILSQESDQESKLNRLCRGMKDKEKEEIKKFTIDYFLTTYNNIYYEFYPQ